MKSTSLEVTTAIQHVTVFTDRAQIVRLGSVALAAGTQELVLPGLPPKLEADSLRANGSGAVAVRILGVELRDRPMAHSPHVAVRELRGEIETVEAEINGLTKQDAVLAQRLSLVEQLASNSAQRYARELAAGNATLDATRQLLNFVAEETQNANEERQRIAFKLRDARAVYDSLRNKLNQYESQKAHKDKCVVVLVDAAAAGQWQVELSYSVPGASWQPVYDARVFVQPTSAGLTGKLELGYGALLTQQTGEDWLGVRLTLSTARPSLGSLPPKLDPIYVDVARPMVAAAPMMAMSAPAPRAKARRLAESDEDYAVMEFADLMEEEPIEAEQVQAEVKSTGSTVTFELPYTLDVPSDGQAHRSQIANLEFPAQLDYLAIPRKVNLAYLRAKVTNTTELTLLEGAVNIFRDGTFVGKDRFRTQAPGQEFKFYLGPEDQIKVERELTGREVDKNFIGNQRRIHYGYAIDVESLKPYPLRLTIQDQVPVSRSENIKVKPRVSEPAPKISDLGIVTWEFGLPANSKRKLTLDYSVEAPRDTPISGLID